MRTYSSFKTMKSNKPADVEQRMLIVGISLFIIWVSLWFWTFKVQVIEPEAYASTKKNAIRTVTLKPIRGRIFDRNNELLVDNVKKNVVRKDGTKFTINRVLTHGELAGHTLGKLRKNGKGRTGLEYSLEKDLAGVDGWELHKIDVSKNIYYGFIPEVTPPIHGYDVVLTLDHRIQAIVEDALKRGVDNVKAMAGTAIVVNPHNGEILAQANYPTVDHNEPGGLTEDQMRNDVLQKSFEPGSTIKVLTAAIAINEGKVKETDIINTENGRYYPCGRRQLVITDHNHYKSLNLEQILAYSSNIGSAKIGQRVDEKIFYKYLRDLGFGTKTEVELSAENIGKLHHPASDSWTKCVTQATMSYGYGISVNPLQLTMALSVVANGGKLFKPKLIKEYRSAQSGELIKENKDHFLRRVITEKTASRTRKLMKSVVEYGTAKSLKINGLSFAGKTGTAEKWNNKTGKYETKKNNSSFVGFLPAESPQYVIYVVLDEPKVHTAGSLTAGPVFKEIAHRLSFNTDYGLTTETLEVESDERLLIPNFESKDLGDVLAWAKINEVKVDREGPGQLVISQFPKFGSVIKKDLELKIQTRCKWNGVPDLKGLSLKKAMALLSERGIKVNYKGEGIVTSQSLEPGADLNENDTCELILEGTQG